MIHQVNNDDMKYSFKGCSYAEINTYYIPEDRTPHKHLSENLKSYTSLPYLWLKGKAVPELN
jgi:hypothetical protein